MISYQKSNKKLYKHVVKLFLSVVIIFTIVLSSENTFAYENIIYGFFGYTQGEIALEGTFTTDGKIHKILSKTAHSGHTLLNPSLTYSIEAEYKNIYIMTGINVGYYALKMDYQEFMPKSIIESKLQLSYYYGIEERIAININERLKVYVMLGISNKNYSYSAIESINNIDQTISISFAKSSLDRGVGLIYKYGCLLYTSPRPRDGLLSRMTFSASEQALFER